MPFKSEKQRRWMWRNKPELAEEWSEKYGSKPKPAGKKKRKPKRKRKVQDGR